MDQAYSGAWHVISVVALTLFILVTAACGSRQQTEAHTTPAALATPLNTASLGMGDETSMLLRKWCADCHLPPAAESHKLREWRYIMLRMQRHRTSGGLPEIWQQDFEKLVSYFESHAQP